MEPNHRSVQTKPGVVKNSGTMHYSGIHQAGILHATLQAEGAIKSLQRALDNMKASTIKGCIHHSDRGLQYCCDAYTNMLNKKGFEISMTEQSDPLEKAALKT